MRRLGAACIVAGLLCTPAMGAASSPFELYRAGKYEEAIAAGESANDGSGLATAARAAFAEANLSDKPCLACLERVQALAQRSIAKDAMHPEAFVYVAAAIGYKARIVGSVRAQLAHYPEIAKEAIDHALAVAPNDDWSLAAEGAWHIEVVRNGGSVLARAIYGARIEEGLEFFARAFAAGPDNLVIRLQYALSLSGYDFDTYREKVADALTAATMIEPRTVYETAIKERAQMLLNLLKANKRREYLALVNRYQGYP